MRARALAVLALLCALAVPVAAVQPDEMLADPGLEARAREISRAVRCPVCQGESIDDSNARISRDLRIIMRVLAERDEEPSHIEPPNEQRVGHACGDGERCPGSNPQTGAMSGGRNPGGGVSPNNRRHVAATLASPAPSGAAQR